MIQYDYTFSEQKKEEKLNEDNIRLAENLSFVFRMFLASLAIISFILVVST